ncbi:hypothetical protein K8T06_04320, partial [bacterium]|nr:hypothetical protein [bacterium]
CLEVTSQGGGNFYVYASCIPRDSYPVPVSFSYTDGICDVGYFTSCFHIVVATTPTPGGTNTPFHSPTSGPTNTPTATPGTPIPTNTPGGSGGTPLPDSVIINRVISDQLQGRECNEIDQMNGQMLLGTRGGNVCYLRIDTMIDPPDAHGGERWDHRTSRANVSENN